MTSPESGFHVVPNPSGWAVEADESIVSTHRKRPNAIDNAQRLARKHGSTVSIHSRAGDVISTKSYEKKPYVAQ
jgi:hypothetical protein